MSTEHSGGVSRVRVIAIGMTAENRQTTPPSQNRGHLIGTNEEKKMLLFQTLISSSCVILQATMPQCENNSALQINFRWLQKSTHLKTKCRIKLVC